MERQNKKSLTYAKPEDDKKALLYKHYKTIQSYQHAMEEFQRKIIAYRAEEKFAIEHSMRNGELSKIQEQLNTILRKTLYFHDTYESI
jgi:hypothetical protein